MKVFLKQIFFVLVIINYTPTVFCAYQPKADNTLFEHGLKHAAWVFGTSRKHNYGHYSLEIGPKDTVQTVKKKIAHQLGVGTNSLTQNNGQEITAKSIIDEIRDVEEQQEIIEKSRQEIMAAYSLVD